jgi:hypothetical protein
MAYFSEDGNETSVSIEGVEFYSLDVSLLASQEGLYCMELDS